MLFLLLLEIKIQILGGRADWTAIFLQISQILGKRIFLVIHI